MKGPSDGSTEMSMGSDAPTYQSGETGGDRGGMCTTLKCLNQGDGWGPEGGTFIHFIYW